MDSELYLDVNCRVLVVDDDRAQRSLLRGLLAKQFDVITAASGAEAVFACQGGMPDLVILDIDMPDMDGIETCRRLRLYSSIPILFVTGYDTPDIHLRAYDAGGNDIVTKPVSSEILLRKANMLVSQSKGKLRLNEEKDGYQEMAMNYLSFMGQSGTLLNFIRSSISCRSHAELAQQLFDATRELGMECSILLRHDDGPTIITVNGEPTPLEYAVLEHAREMGRFFQFSCRLAVNYPRVSIIVSNMPDERSDPIRAGNTRDNVVILAETTEALCENVDMRQESMRRAEQLQVAHTSAVEAVENLREKYSVMLTDTHILIQNMVDQVERDYQWLGINESQEKKLLTELNRSAGGIFAMLAEGGDFETQFEAMIAAMRSGTGETQTQVDLF